MVCSFTKVTVTWALWALLSTGIQVFQAHLMTSNFYHVKQTLDMVVCVSVCVCMQIYIFVCVCVCVHFFFLPVMVLYAWE